MTKTKVHVIDYGIGNIGSIINMFRRIGVVAKQSGDPETLLKADRLVLPGVGAFDRAMKRLRERGLDQVLTEIAMRKGTPVLGICLGMQLLAESSDEGKEPGLNWIPGTVKAMKFMDAHVRVPHMGWAYVDYSKQHEILHGMDTESRFYFAHSYHFRPTEMDDVLLTTDYGGQQLVAAVHRDTIIGMQFHPEKSHRYGMLMFERFARWTP